jgi:hypothetical protein
MEDDGGISTSLPLSKASLTQLSHLRSGYPRGNPKSKSLRSEDGDAMRCSLAWGNHFLVAAGRSGPKVVRCGIGRVNIGKSWRHGAAKYRWTSPRWGRYLASWRHRRQPGKYHADFYPKDCSPKRHILGRGYSMTNAMVSPLWPTILYKAGYCFRSMLLPNHLSSQKRICVLSLIQNDPKRKKTYL